MTYPLERWRSLCDAETFLINVANNRLAPTQMQVEASRILRHYPTPSRAAKLCNVEDEHEYREFCRKQDQSWREGMGL
jgi:hypothetical protein